MFCIKCGDQLNNVSVCSNCSEKNDSFCDNNYLKSPDIVNILKEDIDFEMVMSKNNVYPKDMSEIEEKTDKRNIISQNNPLKTDKDNKVAFDENPIYSNATQFDITYNKAKSVQSPYENISSERGGINRVDMHI